MASGRVEGSLAGLRGGVAVGWAWDADGPDAAALVEILADGEVVASGRAGELRPRLLEAGKGNGRHGFRIALPKAVLDGRQAVLAARVGADGEDLPGSGRTVTLSPAPARKGRRGPSRSDFDSVPPNGKAMALLGRNDWLFLCNQRTMGQLAGISRLDAPALATYEEAFRARRDRFAAAGIPYIFTAVPMKELMHRELLPPGFPLTTQPTPWEQVLQVARRVPASHTIDMRPVLADEMPHEQLYFRTDHHTNLLGSYYVYRELMNQAARYRPELAPRELDDFSYEVWKGWRGDLADKDKTTIKDGRLVPVPARAAGPSTRWDERVMRHRRGSLRAREIPARDIPASHRVSRSRKTRIFEVDDPSLPTAVIVRDSFTEQILPFLAEHFRRSVFVWIPYPPFDLIETEQPDIVLQLMAERFLIRPPLLPGEEDQWDTRRTEDRGAAEDEDDQTSSTAAMSNGAASTPASSSSAKISR